jgi:hypothetical protein
MAVSERALRQRAWFDAQARAEIERERVARPNSRLSEKMFQGSNLIPDAKRGSCSPLGGIAVETKKGK